MSNVVLTRMPEPKTADAADKRAGEGFKTTDWYYSTKSL